MKKYSVIVFDLGNVLIPFDYSSVVTKINSVKPGIGDKFKELYQANYHVHQDFERGKLTQDQFLNIMSEWTENIFADEEFCKIFGNVFTLNKEVIDLLPKLKNNYKLVLLSNTNELHKKYGYGHFRFLKYFDKLILSHEVGVIKPDEKIYRAVEEFTQRPSKEHFFIDDIQEYVDGAKKIGWSGVQFKNFEKLCSDLRTYKIL